MAIPKRPEVEICIRRNSQLHAWMIVQGSHEIPTPWLDTADCIKVATWVKSKADGPVKVRVEL